MTYKVSVILAGGLFLAACRVDFSSELYSRDVISTENLGFPALLEVEVPSCTSDDRPQYERKILSVFSKSSEATIIGCRDDAFTSLLQVDFRGELSSSSSSADLVMFRGQNDAGQTYIMPDLNRDFVTRVNQVLDENFQELTFENVEIAFELHNDSDGVVEYFLPSGWVDGDPGQYIEGTLERREKMLVRTPDVISDLTLEGQQPVVIFLRERE